MADRRVVLASASPRRLALLRRIGVDPVVRPADVDESSLPDEDPAGLVARLARDKAHAADHDSSDLVIAADTVVVLGDHVLAKPGDGTEARAMLSRLSGATHEVLTGVHVRCGGLHAEAVERTEVTFRELGLREIDAYVTTGEPLDKAGGYGIQGAGGMFVERIVGSDSNVVGLPLATVVRLAGQVGVELLPTAGR